MSFYFQSASNFQLPMAASASASRHRHVPLYLFVRPAMRFALPLLTSIALHAADDYSYIVEAAVVPGEMESSLANLCDVIIGVKIGDPLPAIAVGANAVTKEHESFYLIERSYYISQNELRGYLVSVPKASARVKDGSLSLRGLTVKDVTFKQGIKIVSLQ